VRPISIVPQHSEAAGPGACMRWGFSLSGAVMNARSDGGVNMARGQMRKAVFVVLVGAGYVYAAFWTVYFVHGIMSAAANY
jgi:hypothetical protein